MRTNSAQPIIAAPVKSQTPRRLAGTARREDTRGLESLTPLPSPRRVQPSLWGILVLALAIATTAGVLHVHTRVQVYALGEVLTELTAEQTALLDERQRLEAERAYLRNPRHIAEVAQTHLHMTKVAPEDVATLTVPRVSEVGL